MSEIKAYRITGGTVQSIPGHTEGLERTLQILFEQNLEALLGVRFIASEHSTGAIHGGRIDSLGIDENRCPVIIEYKRLKSENVVSQGLYYLDWLMDHKAEFTLLVLKKFGEQAAEMIDWSAPRLICIASDFTKFDEHSIRQINRNIDLVRYKRFGPDLLVLELATTVSATHSGTIQEDESSSKQQKRKPDVPVTELLEKVEPDLRAIVDELRDYCLSLGDDVSEKTLKLYIAFRKLRNFATLVVQRRGVLLYLHLDPDLVSLETSFMRNVRNIGHWGTGDLEILISDESTLHKAMPLIQMAYDAT